MGGGNGLSCPAFSRLKWRGLIIGVLAELPQLSEAPVCHATEMLCHLCLAVETGYRGGPKDSF